MLYDFLTFVFIGHGDLIYLTVAPLLKYIKYYVLYILYVNVRLYDYVAGIVCYIVL